MPPKRRLAEVQDVSCSGSTIDAQQQNDPCAKKRSAQHSEEAADSPSSASRGPCNGSHVPSDSDASINVERPSNSLDWLKRYSIVVADTGDFGSIRKFQPQDATTNPTLLLQAAQMEEYRDLVKNAIEFGLKQHPRGHKTTSTSSPASEALVDCICDKLAVNFGCEILKIVPGVVSTEVNARLSFDTDASVTKAHKLIELYKEAGVDKERVLVKLACTWEGCEAARQLEKEGIHCNMTLLFSKAQAMAAAEAGATLISPFVGRILDWHMAKATAASGASGASTTVGQGPEDPGVKSVREIYKYYKQHNYKTVIMAASFRNIEEVLALSGCDKLTISPKLLDALEKDHRADTGACLKAADRAPEERKAEVEDQADEAASSSKIDEKTFRWMLNCDQMATEKLSDGIRNFHADSEKLEKLVLELVEKFQA